MVKNNKQKKKFRKFDENNLFPPTSDVKKASNSLNTSSDLSATSDSSKGNESVDGSATFGPDRDNSETTVLTKHHRMEKNTGTISANRAISKNKIKYDQNLSYTTGENSNTKVGEEVTAGLKNTSRESQYTNKRDFNQFTRKKTTCGADLYQPHADSQTKRDESYANKTSSRKDSSRDKNYTSSYTNQGNSSSGDYKYPKRNANNVYPRSYSNISRSSDRRMHKPEDAILEEHLDGNRTRSEVLQSNTTFDCIQKPWEQSCNELPPECHSQIDKQLERKDFEYTEADASRNLQQDNHAKGIHLNVHAKTFRPSANLPQPANKKVANTSEHWDTDNPQNNVPDNYSENTNQQKPLKTHDDKKDVQQNNYHRRGHRMGVDHSSRDWAEHDTQNKEPDNSSQNAYQQKSRETHDDKKDYDQNNHHRRGHRMGVDRSRDSGEHDAQNNKPDDFFENTYQQKPPKAPDDEKDFDQNNYQMSHSQGVDHSGENWEEDDTENDIPNDFSESTCQQKDEKAQGYKQYSDQKGDQRSHSVGHFEKTDSWREKSDKNDALPKRYSEGGNSWGSARPWKGRDLLDTNFEKVDKEYKKFQEEKKANYEINFHIVSEIQQDLFTMSKEYSLAHCVAEDMRMGSGIAVNFKRDFKDLDVLLNQRQKQGGLALLEQETADGVRYIYYLVTKRVSNGKPTYETLWSSLKKMRDHSKEYTVKKVAIPRLGCGLDRLEWSTVKHMLEFLFRDVDIEIVVCNFQQTDDSSDKPYSHSSKVVHVKKSIADIEEETSIIYLSTEDGHVSTEMEELKNKFQFLGEFMGAQRKLGDLIKYDVPKKYFILYGCIVRKTIKDPFDFKSFVKCVQQINRNCKKEGYVYVGIQTIKDDEDDLINDKIITILKNYLNKVDIYVCWAGDLVGQIPLSRD